MMRSLAVGTVVVALLAACSGGARQGQFALTTPSPAPALVVESPPASPTPQAAVAPPLAPLRASPGCRVEHRPGDWLASVETAEGERSFRIHLPPGYSASRPAPLVVSFHGSSKTALEQETYSGLVPLADRENFILVTPEGSGFPQEWDVVGIYANAGVDDVVVTAHILQAVKEHFCVDADRVYATGISNGAEMASQVGCFLPELFAAIAPVAGVVYQGCEGRPMPVIAFHGTEDYNVPFDTARPALADWAAHNGCSQEQDFAPVSDHVSVESYRDCTGADVLLYVVEGGGHTWPGAEDDAGGAGPTTHEINASELIWAFFSAHPMPVR
ncbi:MAG: PHB depolymerase family esterase [Tepidiformaceae bacterium]